MTSNSLAWLRAENDQLREENRQLRAALSPETPPPFNLTRSESVIFRRLQCNGYASRETLIDCVALFLKNERCSDETLRVYVSNLRNKVRGRYEIKNVFGQGYLLREVG